MAKDRRAFALDAPRGRSGMLGGRSPQPSSDRFGRFSEAFARAMGTSGFLIGMTVFVVVWLWWNTAMPRDMQFDAAENNYTLLTLILSLQASYAAPLILLAQNRQDDRDRVQIEQDRQRAERNLADTEYLAREVVALRMTVSDLAEGTVTRDVLRQELKAMLDQLDARDRVAAPESDTPAP
ncbi:DUF1003 domain-containing protein [Microbacterium dextranolyticum]|uniref:DUF1003 domain-containing protein n=2 Tax=Microbacterium dextranolyticum TaxID=36806 RepID=A0A9W6M6K4_9MICO|nr:DUF1003 domain-containing protein [Microbacterium dextranolyticum]MBM7463282.1 putative membrane protein [Microbacterium dextranolyticum]GLJ95613.1 hypothetical protein GCM10017591_16760 [Microbacterium dextranolyticum]